MIQIKTHHFSDHFHSHGFSHTMEINAFLKIIDGEPYIMDYEIFDTMTKQFIRHDEFPAQEKLSINKSILEKYENP